VLPFRKLLRMLQPRRYRQAASLEETASSMEELTATVRHNTNNAKHSIQERVAQGVREWCCRGEEAEGAGYDECEGCAATQRLEQTCARRVRK
jgi:hypothetical protein